MFLIFEKKKIIRFFEIVFFVFGSIWDKRVEILNDEFLIFYINDRGVIFLVFLDVYLGFSISMVFF